MNNAVNPSPATREKTVKGKGIHTAALVLLVTQVYAAALLFIYLNHLSIIPDSIFKTALISVAATSALLVLIWMFQHERNNDGCC